ncbi:hypothetical protein BDV95DRAFT_489071 [Massariosphaeria phaeospora]|uniref:DUF1308 domain-containing protein n=1 Tax=Massariosphaeria phaeospora TaxID=100035 RepID=A0A7C8I994_9PLEO|nr:hypothetical protein BDV95DRAFT_489071 [Massariosphaeria phaeospora]
MNSLASSVNDLDLDADANELETTIQTLITRCKVLNEEVGAFIDAVEANQKLAKFPSPVEYRSLRNDFKNELTFLNKLLGSNLNEEKIRHYIVSSNLTYYEAIWEAAKRLSGILAFRKYFFWDRQQEGQKQSSGIAKGNRYKKSAALVDIVATDGTEWVRVSTISQKRLLFDLAKLGWQNDSDDEDEDEDMADAEPSKWEDDDDDDDQIDIVKNVRGLARAARANPIHGRPPRVKIFLTRIFSGVLKEIDAVLQKMKATGATIVCANELPPAPPLAAVLPNLLVDRSRALSKTLNIDCTILLALISDISHTQCPILDWYPAEVRAQIVEEEKEKLLATHLYPAIGSHPMVCTQEAAAQMNLIVDTLATDTEKLRTNLLTAQGEYQSASPDELVAAWVQISDHPVPEGFQLPVRVYPSNLDQILHQLPAVAAKVFAELNPLNQSIFCYGWAQGLTTLSSNRARARQIDHIINQNGLEDGEEGPHIWLCGESRSLIAKQGRRK